VVGVPQTVLEAGITGMADHPTGHLLQTQQATGHQRLQLKGQWFSITLV